ncbi:hypothetical protein EYF80_049085 [Liparis tanakae]|uniref:Uncharacterized protein n=1 Tax=Liparis tanakae TaxID=230148 RepID=A0A4Z2FHN5_9TELE|nr:hypothetical protein EYF80_049085 [Liparis tanakae]
MMGLCGGRWAAGWSMRGGVLVRPYCLDSSKGTGWWCWANSRWWKFSSWIREAGSAAAGRSRLPHWRLTGGLRKHITYSETSCAKESSCTDASLRCCTAHASVQHRVLSG